VTLVDRVTDPVLVPIRRMLPPFRIGGGALDLSPLIVVVGLEIVLSVLRRA
jgi:YggT family protein